MIDILLKSAFCYASLATQVLNPPAESDSQKIAAVDYEGFSKLVDEVADYRDTRLIDLRSFMSMTDDPTTILLDTRSAEAFAAGHIEGAVNLPFSEFTQEKLDALLGDKSAPILIYCNNNFVDNEPPVPLKRVELALNIPTFVNLYGYGYKNIYELGDMVSVADPRIKFVLSHSK